MDKISLKAFGKINLTLDVVGTRNDGYHTIKSIMQTVSLFNGITLEKAHELRLFCNDPLLPTDINNTAFKAANLFFEAYDRNKSAHIYITKQIPYQAGLGSASADAAGTLLGLNRMFGCPLQQDELLKIGLKVGADVPFLMTGGTCLAQGLGETLSPLPPLGKCFIVVACPSLKVSTKEAYSKIDSLGFASNYTDRVLQALSVHRLENCANLFDNIFSNVSHPDCTHRLIEGFLAQGALGASLTGSGSAVFGIFSDISKANAALSPLEKGFICAPVPHCIEFE